MKVIIINASPRANSNSGLLIKEMIKVYQEHNVDYEEIKIGGLDIRGCTACGYCKSHDGCVFNDIVINIVSSSHQGCFMENN